MLPLSVGSQFDVVGGNSRGNAPLTPYLRSSGVSVRFLMKNLFGTGFPPTAPEPKSSSAGLGAILGSSGFGVGTAVGMGVGTGVGLGVGTLVGAGVGVGTAVATGRCEEDTSELQ